MDYALVFGSAFLAATLLPFYSELVLLGFLAAGHEPLLLWLAATSGNTLGAVVNWGMGLGIEHFRNRRWFPASAAQLEQGQRWFARYGIWSLLLAWAPIGGDALTVIAGIMRVHIVPFVVLVAIGKGLRYALLVALGLGLIEMPGLL